MNTEEFMKVWADKELRQYIVNQARRHSKRPELQEEYIQEAWLCISCAPGDCDCEGLKELAYQSIYSSYWQYHKEELVKGGLEHAKNPRSKTPERMTDSDPLFMAQKRNWNWRK